MRNTFDRAAVGGIRVSDMASERFAEGTRRVILAARVLCSLFMVVAVGFGVIAWVIARDPANQSTPEWYLIPVLVLTTGFALSFAVYLHVNGPSLFAHGARYPVPVLYAFVCCSASAMIEGAVLMGLVGTMVTGALWPYLAVLAPSAIIWLLVWPRRRTLDRWAMRAGG